MKRRTRGDGGDEDIAPTCGDLVGALPREAPGLIALNALFLVIAIDTLFFISCVCSGRADTSRNVPTVFPTQTFCARINGAKSRRKRIDSIRNETQDPGRRGR